MKTIVLISGGLDSILAARIVKDLGLEVIGLHFKTVFELPDRDKKKRSGFVEDIVSKENIKLKTVFFGEDFLSIVKKPKHGYGGNLNPCIDCRIWMLKKAKELMQQEQASFIVTGEVLGQRAMSQHLRTMVAIDKEAGVEGMNLRPLSAKLLEETIPEKNGWVPRDKLYDFSGRSRRGQIDLAISLGIMEFSQPAGGCLLTDRQFSNRLKDLMKQGIYDLANVELLKYGRHFRLADNVKLVVGRNAFENEQLLKLVGSGDCLLEPSVDIAGPTALVRGGFNKDLLMLSSRIVCRYCDLNGKPELEIYCTKLPGQDKEVFRVLPLDEEQMLTYRL